MVHENKMISTIPTMSKKEQTGVSVHMKHSFSKLSVQEASFSILRSMSEKLSVQPLSADTNVFGRIAKKTIRLFLKEKKLNVYIPTISTNEWMGGTVYYNNLLAALEEHAPSIDILRSIVQLTPEQVLEQDKISIRKIDRKIIRKIVKKISSSHDRKQPTTLFYGYSIHDQKSPGEILLPLDAIFSINGLYVDGVPIVAWIPDFQHVRLPEMFSQEEIAFRNAYYREAAERSTLIVFSSKDALSDFSHFVPEHREKGRVMSFCTSIAEDIYSKDSSATVAKYQLPNKFFYLPNQFWKHKNHSVVIHALDILKEKGSRPVVVCTGNTGDYRHPEYYSGLLHKIKDLGLLDQFIFLGLIPREDVFQLIRHSICIINPSLFEGWSNSVEEVKSIGKTIVLSDIAVHREQNPKSAVYFDPYNASFLSDILMHQWNDAVSGPSKELEAYARSNLPIRLKAFADTFVAIMREAHNRYHPK